MGVSDDAPIAPSEPVRVGVQRALFTPLQRRKDDLQERLGRFAQPEIPDRDVAPCPDRPTRYRFFFI